MAETLQRVIERLIDHAKAAHPQQRHLWTSPSRSLAAGFETAAPHRPAWRAA